MSKNDDFTARLGGRSQIVATVIIACGVGSLYGMAWGWIVFGALMFVDAMFSHRR